MSFPDCVLDRSKKLNVSLHLYGEMSPQCIASMVALQDLGGLIL
ncbi:hypothetical protein [Leptospira interrogans]|nr:hypothetical protein LEP1GSC007_2523 [Leptospira interrogans serovar Bulgarica str. Mallika]